MKITTDPVTIIGGYYGQQHNNGIPFNRKDYRPAFRHYLDQVVNHALPGYRVPDDLDEITGRQLKGNDLAVRNYYPITVPLEPPHGKPPAVVYFGADGKTLRVCSEDPVSDAKLKVAHEAYP